MRRHGWRLAAYRIVPSLVCLLAHYHSLLAWFRADDFAWLSLAGRVHGFHDLLVALFKPMAQGTIRPFSDRGFFLAGYALFWYRMLLPFHAAVFITLFANLALVAWIGTRITGSRSAGFWAAIFWALNSVLVEPLGWVCVYNQVLWGFFVLLAFHFLLRYVETGERCYEVLQWTAFVLGFGALELNVVYPALAALYTWLYARRYFTRTLPMFAVSALFTALHLAAMPAPKAGEYAMHFTGSMARTFLTYVTWSVGPTLLGNPFRAPAWLVIGGVVLVIAGLAAFAVRQARGALFCWGWFLIVLAPVLPLRDHLTEYYPYLALVGLCWFGGWAATECWRSNRIAVVAVGALYAVLVVPRTVAADAWNYRLTLRARDLVEGVASAEQMHPRQVILLEGVDPELFYNAIEDRPFRLLESDQVYLTPASLRTVATPGDAGVANDFALPAEEIAAALERHEAVVYDVRGPRLRNITAQYSPGPAAKQAPSRIDVASPLVAFRLGPEWYPAESGHRWMPGRATLHLAAPQAAGLNLHIEGYFPPEQLRQGAVSVTASADGLPLGTRNLEAGQDTFDLSFPLPGALVGKPEMAVEISVSRTFRVAGDSRDLGLAVRSVEVR